MNLQFEERDITPATTNHDLEGSGHSYLTGLREFIDNAIDSGSEVVKVFLDKDANNNPILVIIDHGTGFKDVSQGLGVDNLHLMAKKNYSTKDRPTSKNPNGNVFLGRYGNGIKNALAKMTDSKHASIMSCEAGSTVYLLEYNQKHIQQTGEYKCNVRPIVYVRKQEDTYRHLWLKYMSIDEYGSLANSGTVVILRGLKPEVYHSLKNSMGQNVTPMKQSLAIKLGETYHRFIEKGVDIQIGLSFDSLYSIKPTSPTLGLTPYITMDYTIADHPVKLNVYMIPIDANKEKDFYRPRTNQNQGVYVYRSNRLHLTIDEKPMNLAVSQKALIAYNHNKVDLLGNSKKKSNPNGMNPLVFSESHGLENHIRFTLDFPPALDSYFNVNTIKTEISLQNDAFEELGVFLKNVIITYHGYDTGFKVRKTRTKSTVDSTVESTVKPVATTTKVAEKPKSHTVWWNKLLQDFSVPVKDFKISLLEEIKPEERKSVENALSLFTCFLGKEI
jgi:hypothetical protein